MYRETRLRSLLKVVSWRICGTLATAGIVLVMTGRLAIAASVGVLELVSKSLLAFLHERAWDRLKFGRTEARPVVIWLTGLPGSGKTEIGRLVAEALRERGRKVEFLDGRSVRHLFPELGFSSSEVDHHIKRVGHLAGRLEANGISTVASFVSPYRSSRRALRGMTETLIEVHVDATPEECEARRKDDFYERARRGELNFVPGVSTPYEAPEAPDIRLSLRDTTPAQAARRIVELAERRSRLDLRSFHRLPRFRFLSRALRPSAARG